MLNGTKKAMVMNKKISIIVPVYNVEKYIAKCLGSLVCQDYDNYDIIVVNDGSPYNEQTIIDEYVKKYPRLIKSIVKENGGYGSVLELAFSKSDAEYILVCDSDDYIAPNALSTLMSYRDESNADLVVGAKYLVYEDSNEEKYDPSYNSEFGKLIDKKIYESGTKDFEMLYFLEPSPHAKLYKRDIVKNIKFPHKVSYTDNLLYFYTLTRINKVVYCKEGLSYYLINRTGNTRTDLKPTIIDSWITVFSSILEQTDKADDIFYYRMFESFYSIYYKLDNVNCDESTKLDKYNIVYLLLDKLINYKKEILRVNNIYQNDNATIKKQKEKLLTRETSKTEFDRLVKERLHGSFKSKLKNKIQNNKLLSKVYEVYHFNAKYIKARNDKKIELNGNVKCYPVFSDDKTYFFGYYDKPCFKYEKSIAHRINTNSLNYNQVADIIVGDELVSSTKTWNWQQGSMATWYDKNHIIHNDFDGKKFISKIVDINTKGCKVIDFPIYSLSKDKKFALSLNFSRLAKLRKDYGYFNLPYDRLPDDNEDGIYYVDINNNKYELYLSLNEIKNFMPKDSMKDAVHKVNHIDISPNSDKAIFLHRWFVGKTKYTRLLCMNIKSKKLSLLADNDMVSHMAWYNNEKVFGYLKGNNNKDGYFFIDINGNQEQFENELLVDDGHPSVLNERYIVTDTYPDYTCKSKLLLIDLKLKTVNIIGRFYSGKKYQNDKRCDLHPRFDGDSFGKLTIDSVANGKKNIYHIDINNMIE